MSTMPYADTVLLAERMRLVRHLWEGELDDEMHQHLSRNLSDIYLAQRILNIDLHLHDVAKADATWITCTCGERTPAGEYVGHLRGER